MAQWVGQFTGLSHNSKLADAEQTLRTAISSYRASSAVDVTSKAKAVRRLAERVLNLRVKLLKARRNALGPMTNEQATELASPEQALLEAGIEGILAEFGVADLSSQPPTVQAPTPQPICVTDAAPGGGPSMTEAEWLECREWQPMLEYLDGRMGERKSILYVCAGLRSIWHLLYSMGSQRAVVVAERYADGFATEEDIRVAAWSAEPTTWGYDFDPEHVRRQLRSGNLHMNVRQLLKMGVYIREDILGSELLGDPVVVSQLINAASVAEHVLYIGEQGPHENLLQSMKRISEWPGGWLVREVFGNPFRPVTFAPEWRTADVIAMARKAYEDRAFDALPILADAVEEAGCDEVDLLAHLRGDGPHVLGCWALDLVFGEHRRTNTPPT